MKNRGRYLCFLFLSIAISSCSTSQKALDSISGKMHHHHDEKSSNGCKNYQNHEKHVENENEGFQDEGDVRYFYSSKSPTEKTERMRPLERKFSKPF